MKLKLYLFLLTLFCFTQSYAANEHLHPNIDNRGTPVKIEKPTLGWPGYCEIEIMNHSYRDVRVSGVFDDGIGLEPFTVYSFESPHYISLFYYGYCHDGMDLYINDFYGNSVFSGYVRRYSSIRVVPSSYGKLQVNFQQMK